MNQLFNTIRRVMAEYSAEFGVSHDRMMSEMALGVLSFAVLFIDTALIIAQVRP